MDNDIDTHVRFYEQGDEPQIVELLKKTFPKWKSYKDPVGLWRWKYINSPNKTYVTLTLVDEKIIACDHLVIFNAKIGTEDTTISWGDDLAVDIEYRGQGVWKKMHDFTREKTASESKYTYSTTDNPILIKNWKKNNLGILPHPVTRMVKSKNIQRQLEESPIKNKNLNKIGYIGLRAINGLSNLFKKPIKLKSKFTINQISEFDEDINIFWEKIKDNYLFILEKKMEYLNWRFTDNDRANHTKFIAYDKEEVLGYVVVGTSPSKSEGLIEDMIALDDRIDVADALFETACKYLEKNKNSVFYQVIEGHKYCKLSARHGFINSRSRPFVAFDLVEYYRDKGIKLDFLEYVTPDKVYFNYATTI